MLTNTETSVIDHCGYPLAPWQRYVLDRSLDKRYVRKQHDRQTGGTQIAVARILVGLQRHERMLYLSESMDVSLETMYRVQSVVESNPDVFTNVNVRLRHSEEGISNEGASVRFRSIRGMASGRGASYDLVIIDAPNVKDSFLQEVSSVLSATGGQLLWLQSVELEQSFI